MKNRFRFSASDDDTNKKIPSHRAKQLNSAKHLIPFDQIDTNDWKLCTGWQISCFLPPRQHPICALRGTDTLLKRHFPLAPLQGPYASFRLLTYSIHPVPHDTTEEHHKSIHSWATETLSSIPMLLSFWISMALLKRLLLSTGVRNARRAKWELLWAKRNRLSRNDT